MSIIYFIKFIVTSLNGKIRKPSLLVHICLVAQTMAIKMRQETPEVVINLFSVMMASFRCTDLLDAE